MDKETMNLKRMRDVCVKGFERRKEKGETMLLYYNLRKKKKDYILTDY